MMIIFAVFLLLFGCRAVAIHLTHDLHIFIITQNAQNHIQRAERIRSLVGEESAKLGVDRPIRVTISTEQFPSSYGANAVWPLLADLEQLSRSYFNAQPYWLFVIEDHTFIHLESLISVLNNHKNPASNDVFLGHALVDVDRSIIHHYQPGLRDVEPNEAKHKYMLYDSGEADGILRYPDFGVGVTLSSSLVLKVVSHLQTREKKASDFTIDPKYEFAKLVLDASGTRLSHITQYCLTPSDKSRENHCASELLLEQHDSRPHHDCSMTELVNGQLMFMVKTCSRYHNDRVPIVKRTWAYSAEHIAFWSDVEDLFIPTITLSGVDNTERGHCAKTLGIMRRSIDMLEWNEAQWLVISDDDTLLSIERLIEFLKCYNSSTPLIIGEKYGFGYSLNGENGYDYPTGGSGMIFSLPAIGQLIEHCECPKPDSPDDMIIGMCARRQNIPIIHSRQLHQARPREYAKDHLQSTPAISFHKHNDVDPFEIYRDYLAPADWKLLDVPKHQQPYKMRVDEKQESKTNEDVYKEMMNDDDFRTAHKTAKHGEEL